MSRRKNLGAGRLPVEKIPRRCDGVDIDCCDGRQSILLCKHDRQDARRLFRIARIFGAELTTFVVVVDLPKELSPDERKAAEIMLPVRIVVRRKIRERCDLDHRFSFHAVRQFANARCHHRSAAPQGHAEGVIELANAVRVHSGTATLDETGEDECGGHRVATA